MTSRLHFARATHIGVIDSEPVERILAEDDHVVRQNRAELEWKSIERPFEFVRGQEKRRRQTTGMPVGDVAGAFRQVFSRQRFDNRQRLRARELVVTDMVRGVSGPGYMKGVRDQRLQANAEYFLDFAHKNRHLFGHVRHVAIVR